MRRLLALLAFFLFPCSVHAAGSLYLAPESGTYAVGDVFDVEVLAETPQQIHAAEAELRFDPSVLAVETVVTDGSIFGAWPTAPRYSNEDGVIAFSGWTRERFSGSAGLLVTVRFRALANGISNVFLASGAVLAADGQSSNVVSALKSGSYRVAPAVVVPPPPEASTNEGAVLGAATAADDRPASAARGEFLVLPVIEDYSHEISAGDRIEARGTAAPRADVRITLSREGDAVAVVRADEDGSFSYTSDPIAQAGVYRMHATVQSADATESLSSEPLSIAVRAPRFAAAALIGADIAWAMLPFLALLALSGMGIALALHLRRARRESHS